MSFDPYRRWLKIPSDRRPPTYYDLLGLARRETDHRRIHEAAQDRYDHVRKYTLGPAGPERDAAQRVLGELSEALYCLADAKRRREYDRQLDAAASGAGAKGDPFQALQSLLDEEIGQSPSAAARPAQLASKQCPHCQAWLIPGAVLCVRCGTDLRTGEKLSTVVAEDEEEEPAEFGELLAAAWSSLVGAFRQPDDGDDLHRRPASDTVARASTLLGVAIALGVMLLCAAALYPFVSRMVAHYQMDKIVRNLHFSMVQNRTGGKPPIGVEGNVPIAARKFARYLRHAPSYLAKQEGKEGRAATKKRSYLLQIIRELPAGANLEPLRDVPSDCFAYDAAQEVLAREEDEDP